MYKHLHLLFLQYVEGTTKIVFVCLFVFLHERSNARPHDDTEMRAQKVRTKTSRSTAVQERTHGHYPILDRVNYLYLMLTDGLIHQTNYCTKTSHGLVHRTLLTLPEVVHHNLPPSLISQFFVDSSHICWNPAFPELIWISLNAVSVIWLFPLLSHTSTLKPIINQSNCLKAMV